MPTALRRFQLPPRPLNDLGGPPPLALGGGIPYGDGAELTPPGPPPLDRELLLYPQLQAPNPVPLEQREDLAMASPTADWMFEPYRPTEQELQVRPALQRRPGERPGGLRRALAKILPIARDLAMSTAAGANEPTAIGGLGAGIAQSEARQRADETRQLQAIHNWQKMQVEAAKTQAEIEKMGAETEKAREEKRLLEPKYKSDAELKTQQAAAARDRAAYDAELTRHKEYYRKKGGIETDIGEKAVRAANYTLRNKMLQEELDSGKTRKLAELSVDQRLRIVADTKRIEALTAEIPGKRERQDALDESLIGLRGAQRESYESLSSTRARPGYIGELASRILADAIAGGSDPARAIDDAKRNAMEYYIGDPDIEDNRTAIIQELERMRGKGRARSATSRMSDGGTPGGGPPISNDAPPASLLKEGFGTPFENGQIWTLRNGQPVRVK